MKHESREEHIMSDEAGAGQRPMSRRDALKAAGLAGAAALLPAAVAPAQAADEKPTAVQAANPYGGVPSGGITLPPYYRPTPYLVSNNIYYPGQEQIGPDEMRISFIGSTPIPVTRAQAGTCIMVELGNGKRFFFDFGSGCMRNIIAMAVPLQTVNDIFFTHLHVDHYADLAYLFAFAPWMGRWKPLRVHGPSGRTPKDGIKTMIEGMKMMTQWHTDSFNALPIGSGYEIEVNEFDFRDDNGVCYDKDGVVIRHWRRAHIKDGASAYRLDWNGLSFVWTGDGLEGSLRQTQNALSVLLARPPRPLPEMTAGNDGIPKAELDIIIDMPADLLRRRPDGTSPSYASARFACCPSSALPCQPSLACKGDPEDGDRQILTERSGGDVDPRKHRRRMAFEAACELAERHEFVVGDATGRAEERVVQRGGVAPAEDQVIVRGVLRLRPVVAEMAGEQNGHQIGGRQRRRGMAGARGRRAADRVGAQLAR